LKLTTNSGGELELRRALEREGGVGVRGTLTPRKYLGCLLRIDDSQVYVALKFIYLNIRRGRSENQKEVMKRAHVTGSYQE
jgi:hypothetical protein